MQQEKQKKRYPYIFPGEHSGDTHLLPHLYSICVSHVEKSYSID
jgi:hypothetical protein